MHTDNEDPNQTAALRPDAPVRNVDDLLKMLDKLLSSTTSDDGWWNIFFADRTKSVPFFVEWPDETLVSDFETLAMRPGHVLELGCGNVRNAEYLASRGCSGDAMNFPKLQ